MNTPRLRLVRLAPDPLGLYIRAGRIGSKDLQNFIASGVTAFNGVVFEAKRLNTQRELLSLVIDKGLDAVLDPQTQAMATPGGYTANMAKLPWGSNAQQTVADFSSPFLQKQIAESIAEFAISNGFTQVLSPTHFISGPDDPWLPIDLAMTKLLRNALDRKGGAKVEVQYSLATTYVTFRTKDVRQKIVSQLATASINGLWLNISGCGSDSSPTAITRYAEAATDFHALSIPIIADHAGGLMGLSLLAFGAVGGLSHGITGGERFDVTSWFNPSTSPSFGQKPRIYISNLDLLIEKVDAEKFFEAGGGRAKTAFGCRNTNCCHRGVDDMLQAPIRHYLFQRMNQVAGLGRIPESLRSGQFLEETVRPASDVALLAKKFTLPEKLERKIDKQAKRLNDLRTTLGPYARERRDASFARHPILRVARG